MSPDRKKDPNSPVKNSNMKSSFGKKGSLNNSLKQSPGRP